MLDQPTFDARRKARVDSVALLQGLQSASEVAVVIPVFNGGDVVRQCLESAIRHSGGAAIIVFDDASTDPETVEMLDELAAGGDIELVRHADNRGYTSTINEATAFAADRDVVLLNSDTVVGPLWLQRLRWAAYSHPDIASASALSDNAGAMAVPKIGQANDWPGHLDWSELARRVANSSTTFTVDTPTAHGFCVYLRRDALTLVGNFDEDAFPRGYGEENDWSMRAIGAGLRNVVAPQVFVKHAQGHTFGSGRNELIAAARTVLDAKHPNYRPFVGQWVGSPEMTMVREHANVQLLELESMAEVLPVVLYVLHASGGGTPATNRDLMGALQLEQDSLLLLAKTNSVELLRWDPSGGVVLESWRPSRAFTVRDSWRQDYAEVVARWLVEYGIEVIHIRHLINQPLTTVPRSAELLGIPVVLSTHDFYYVCPSVHLLDEKAVFCGGICTPGAGHCTAPTTFVAHIPNLKHGWVYEWRSRVTTVMESSARVIATTRSAAEIYQNNFPDLHSKLTIIEHGRDLEAGWDRLRDDRPRRPGPLRVACPANWQLHKGTEYLRTVIGLGGESIEWHVLGVNSDLFSDVAVVHGQYRRDTMRAVFDEIDPDFVGLFSIWPETYSHTLTEAWALGIPVVATDIGAIADRINDFGGGELFPVESPSRAAQFLREAANRALYSPPTADEVNGHSVRSRHTMAMDYAVLYDEVRNSRSRPVVGYSIRGRAGRHPGSAHVRIARRVRNRRESARATYRQLDLNDYVRGLDTTSYQTLLIQRDSVPAELVEGLLARARRDGTSIVVDVDDDLMSPEARERLEAQGYSAGDLDGLATLLKAADTVTVSTAGLGGVVEDFVGEGHIEVYENRLDGRLWGSAVHAVDEAVPKDEIRVLYMGSSTHGEDLELLKAAFEDLTTTDGRKIVLEIVGVTEEESDWYQRLAIPPRARNYPEFVRWLRAHRSRWSYAVAPLVDVQFNHAKSDIKFLEYSMLGLATLASNVGPYIGTERHGVTLVTNEAKSWRSALVLMATDTGLRDRSSALARDYTAASRMLQATEHLDVWEQSLLGAVTPGSHATSS